MGNHGHDSCHFLISAEAIWGITFFQKAFPELWGLVSQLGYVRIVDVCQFVRLRIGCILRKKGPFSAAFEGFTVGWSPSRGFQASKCQEMG